MSYYDYLASKQLREFPFYALIMAAMSKADTPNLTALRRGFPDVWDELNARYHAQGGLLDGES